MSAPHEASSESTPVPLTATVDDTARKRKLLSDIHAEALAAAPVAYDLYEQSQEIEHLMTAVHLYQTAIDAATEPDPHLLGWLGYCLWAQYHRQGDVTVLERAIVVRRRALELTPDGHSDQAVYLNDMGRSLQSRFEHLGELEDLDSAVTLQRRAVELTPHGHPDEPDMLGNLARSHGLRYNRLGNVDDLERAIEVFQQAEELTPDDDPWKPVRLNNLGFYLRRRFERLGKPEDIERAISIQQRAIDIAPKNHPDLPVRIGNLAQSQDYRYERFGQLGDLEHAIAGYRRADELTSLDHPKKPVRLNNLGFSLCRRFEHLGKLTDLKGAILMLQRAVDLTSESNPDRAIRLYNLGHSLDAHFRVEMTGENFNAAVSSFVTATTQSLGPTSHKLWAAQRALRLVARYPEFCTQTDLLLAHSRILDILPELAWLGHSVPRRLEESQRFGNFVSAAVCAAVEAGALERAVEWLEAGRGSLWTQVLSLRSPVDELEQCHPDLARTLKDIRAKFQTSMAGQLDPDAYDFSTELATDHRRLAIQYGNLLSDVRRQLGFEDFMRPKKLSALLPSLVSLSGPIVFINVDRTRCDAVLLFPDHTIKCIPLPELSLDGAHKLHSFWSPYLKEHRVRHTSWHYSVEEVNQSVCRMFGFIWQWITYPVLQALALYPRTNEKRLPHVTWCPTGPLTQLPLHAAGIYDDKFGPRVHDFVVSSYTPSLSALTRSAEEHSVEGVPKALLVTQPDTPNLSQLPGTITEGKHLRRILSEHRIEFSALDRKQASVEAVRSVLGEHTWLHLACHGFQNVGDPLKSAFALYDGRLSLSDLMTTTADKAELAFLSACQTAVGDEKVPEESMHLAAGMLAVGFNGVVATMWSIRDDDAPLAVEVFYETLIELRASGMLEKGETGAAYALHEATKRLREKVGETEFVRWAPFVHFGI